MNPQRISFHRTLPILALLLSYVIIAVPATMAYINVKSASRNGNDVIVRYHQIRRRIPHEHFVRASVGAGAEISSHFIQAINMPGFLLDLAADRCSRFWPNELAPWGLDFAQWRALSFPIFCLPFWWIAGFALDALLERYRLSWLVLLLGFSLWVAFLVTGTGLWLAARNDNPENLIFPFWGFGLWAILLSAFPIAWLKQALAHRRIKTSLHARLSAETQ